MLKVLDIDPYFFGEEPSITLLEGSSTLRGLTKKATDSRVQDYVSGITPEAGKIYIHILAMGAGEFYGANRNGDYFPEENLKKYHDTFYTSPAHIFKHHINKNPEIAIGQVIFSIYNERMHRVEIIAWVDRNKGYDYVSRIENGEFPATSMACHTPYDTCSICGNQARSRSEYCTHLNSELGKTTEAGKKTMAINNGPLKFFDMSFVFKPAEVTSSVLQKLASAEPVVVGSAENAEIQGLTEKKAQIQGLTEKKAQIHKLSELIKEIEGDVVSSSDSLKGILSTIKDPEPGALDILVRHDISNIIHVLADIGVCPSVGFFANLIGRKVVGEEVDGIEHLVKGLLLVDPDLVELPHLNVEKSASDNSLALLRNSVLPFCKKASMFEQDVMNRLFDGRDGNHWGPSNNIGYIGNGPGIAPDPRLAYMNLKRDNSPQGQSLLKTLIAIGGAAVAAKWLISKLVEDKTRNVQPSTKIVIVKSAHLKLIKAGMLMDLTQNTQKT